MINAFGVSPCVAAKHEPLIATAMHAKLGARGKLPQNKKSFGGNIEEIKKCATTRERIKAVIAANPGLYANDLHEVFKLVDPTVNIGRLRYYLYEMRSAHMIYSKQMGRPKRLLWYVSEEK